jgi:hypothetical protein
MIRGHHKHDGIRVTLQRMRSGESDAWRCVASHWFDQHVFARNFRQLLLRLFDLNSVGDDSDPGSAESWYGCLQVSIIA